MKEVSQRITAYSMEDFPRGWEEVKPLSLLLTTLFTGLPLSLVVSSSIHATGLDGTDGRCGPCASS